MLSRGQICLPYLFSQYPSITVLTEGAFDCVSKWELLALLERENRAVCMSLTLNAWELVALSDR